MKVLTDDYMRQRKEFMILDDIVVLFDLAYNNKWTDEWIMDRIVNILIDNGYIIKRHYNISDKEVEE